MKKALPYLIGEVVLSLIIALYATSGSSDSFLTTFGLVNLILGIIGLVFGVIFSIARVENVSKGLLISSALILLMGFLTCSIAPMKFN
jgi:hypothetical protein